MRRFAALQLLVLCLLGITSCHHVITYPGWRGNNLMTDRIYPNGYQWQYPCGGLPIREGIANRTYWPLDGGAVAIQPGWFQGGKDEIFYVNLGIGAQPLNHSFSMVPAFHISGPTFKPYPGTFCLPKISLPEGYKPEEGDLATIQVVQAHYHGAATYSCVDIVFTADESLIPELSPQNCFNSTTIKLEAVRYAPFGDETPISSTSTGTATSTEQPTVTVPTTSASVVPTGGAARASGYLGALGFLLPMQFVLGDA